MSRDVLKSMVDMLSESDIETIYNVMIHFVPDDKPYPDEVDAIRLADLELEAVPHEAIDWT